MRQIAFWRIKAKLLFNLAPKAMSPCLEEGEKEFFKERKGRAANEHPTRREDAPSASALIRLTRWDVISEADSWKSPRELMPGASRGCSIEEVTEVARCGLHELLHVGGDARILRTPVNNFE